MWNCGNSFLVWLIVVVTLAGCVSTPEKPATQPAARKPVATTAPEPAFEVSSAAENTGTRSKTATSEMTSRTALSTQASTVFEAKVEPSSPTFDNERAPEKPVGSPSKATSKSIPQPAPGSAKPEKVIPEPRVDKKPVEWEQSRKAAPDPMKKPDPVQKKPLAAKPRPVTQPRVTEEGKSREQAKEEGRAKPTAQLTTRPATDQEINKAVAAVESTERAGSEETRIAMLSKPAPVTPDVPDISKLSFELEHLPIKFSGGWELDKRPDQIDGRERCLLYSPKLAMFDGYDKSHVQLQVTTRAVVVKADANLDASYPNQGLRVDSGALFAFEPELLNESVTHTKKPVQSSMASGKQLTVALGFWPTWPMTRTQELTVDLNGFSHAYRALQACTKQ